jgi:hypothetical protein
MMTKSEAETAIRLLCREWRRTTGFAETPEVQLSFSGFLSWLRQHHAIYLTFRTTTSVEYDAELWFDSEFKQSWAR